jgi:pyridoxal phosphate enzyme (YggS family)
VSAIDVAANLQRLGERIATACRRAGRDPDGVRLVAVTKRIDLTLVADAVRAGQLDLGENRIQDALPRQDELTAALAPDAPPVRWHFIGHLQRNKAARAAGRFALIHGVHSPELAERLARKARELAVVQPVLLQVNITGEPQKDGLAPGQVVEVACAVAEMPGLELRGLMAMGRFGATEAELRGDFSRVRDLRDGAARACGAPLDELSLGMSGDFEAAILEGATLLRIGTAVFGPRTT